MTAALDTNLLLYAEGIHGGTREHEARSLIEQLPPLDTILPAQVLGELYNVLAKKSGRTRAEAYAAVLKWQDTFSVVAMSAAAMLSGIALASEHQLQVWDAALLATAAEAGYMILITEDLQDGFRWRGVTVANPFARPRHALLNRLLAQ